MARKTKEESQKTRDGILDAAERVFLEKGVGTTAMADLADAAGVSRGAVYGHYKNKIEVCLAMCDRAFGQIEVPDENARVPAWAFSASAASPVRCSGCWRSSTSSANAATRTSRCCAAASCSRSRGNASASGRSAGRWSRLDVELASIYLQSLWDGICGTQAWTERLRDDPWNRAERMFRAGLDSLRSSPYLLLADA